MDEWRDGQTDGQTDDSDFIGRCPTNVESSTCKITTLLRLKNPIFNYGV